MQQRSSTDEGRVASHPPRVKWVCSACSLKCLYTNARSVGSKQEELEIRVQAGGKDLGALSLENKADGKTETCQPSTSGVSDKRGAEKSDALTMERLYRQLLVSLKRPKTKN